MVGAQRKGQAGDVTAVDQSRLPSRFLPVAYFALAHASLSLAFALVAIDPRGAAGFFYHPRMLAIVHLVTLGWITSSILGSLYLVGPIALRTTFPARWPDYLAAALAAVGVIGVAGHFWIAEYGGMAWSGAAVGSGVLVVGARVLPRLWRAPVPLAIRVHVLLAFLNVLAAAGLGVLLGINRVHPFMTGFALGPVFAHAHLAAIGWAALMVVGVGYRLLPMVLPARMPAGPRLWWTAILLQIGVGGLFVTLLLHLRATGLFAVIVVAGFATFLVNVIWMVRHSLPKPPAIKRPDAAVLHAGAAFASLAAASALGLWLAFTEMSEMSLRLAAGYGVLGLIGFLAQMVVAMEGRLLPLFAWYWAFARTEGRGPVVSPHEMPWHAGQLAAFPLWLFGVTALATGVMAGAVPLVGAGAWVLLAASILSAAQAAIVLRHAWR
jgi:hypothetical protein